MLLLLFLLPSDLVLVLPFSTLRLARNNSVNEHHESGRDSSFEPAPLKISRSLSRSFSRVSWAADSTRIATTPSEISAMSWSGVAPVQVAQGYRQVVKRGGQKGKVQIGWLQQGLLAGVGYTGTLYLLTNVPLRGS